MRNFDHLIPATPEARQRELTRILAIGLLRLRGHLPIPPEVAIAKNPDNSSPACLELRPNLSVTVHTG
jgi:hypothetical protein